MPNSDIPPLAPPRERWYRLDMAESLDALVTEFLARYHEEGSPAVPVGTRLQSLLNRLDAFYWKEAEDSVAAAIVLDVDALRFDAERRFRLDTGLLDPRLVTHPEPHGAERLRAEFEVEGDGEIWRLSQWLSDRSQTFGVLAAVQENGASAAPAPDLEARRRIYESLGPLIEHLPGVPADFLERLRSGWIDRRIRRLAPHVGADPRIREQHDKLRALREAILRQARRRCTLRQQLSLFDALEELRATEEQGPDATRPTAAPETRRFALGDRRHFLLSELRLVRAFLRLGAPGSGVARVHSVLVGSAPRTRRATLLPLIRLVHTCDARLPDPLRVCIAPFTGTGFFEWDRDTLFIPLTPTRSEEEALLSAVGHYRLMLDSQQDEGRIRKRYAELFGAGNVEQRFLVDYRQWIQGAGRGMPGALSERSLEFFREEIGPSAETLFAPAEIRILSPQEGGRLAETCRRRIEQGGGGAEDHYRLALLGWREGREKTAFDHVALAVRLDRTNGAYLFTLGHLCALRGMREKAHEAYHACLARSPNTLWSLYAMDALKRMA